MLRDPRIGDVIVSGAPFASPRVHMRARLPLLLLTSALAFPSAGCSGGEPEDDSAGSAVTTGGEGYVASCDALELEGFQAFEGDNSTFYYVPTTFTLSAVEANVPFESDGLAGDTKGGIKASPFFASNYIAFDLARTGPSAADISRAIQKATGTRPTAVLALTVKASEPTIDWSLPEGKALASEQVQAKGTGHVTARFDAAAQRALLPLLESRTRPAIIRQEVSFRCGADEAKTIKIESKRPSFDGTLRLRTEGQTAERVAKTAHWISLLPTAFIANPASSKAGVAFLQTQGFDAYVAAVQAELTPLYAYGDGKITSAMIRSASERALSKHLEFVGKLLTAAGITTTASAYLDAAGSGGPPTGGTAQAGYVALLAKDLAATRDDLKSLTQVGAPLEERPFK